MHQEQSKLHIKLDLVPAIIVEPAYLADWQAGILAVAVAMPVVITSISEKICIILYRTYLILVALVLNKIVVFNI